MRETREDIRGSLAIDPAGPGKENIGGRYGSKNHHSFANLGVVFRGAFGRGDGSVAADSGRHEWPFDTMSSFLALIDELMACPAAERVERERRIHDAFEHERAVLALDMSGYSLSVRRGGILSHLCKIRRMQREVRPLVERFHGEVVRELADNVLATFPAPANAIQAAVAINHAVYLSQQDQDGDPLLTVSIGIDYGKLLLISGHDCFGESVNIAFKLGEDVAEAGEILITENARQGLGATSPFPLKAMQLSVSGLELLAYRIGYEPPQ